jgi:hypothetical protein
MAGQVILSAAYGIHVLLQGDPFVEDAEIICLLYFGHIYVYPSGSP